VKAVTSLDGDLPEAFSPMSVTVTLEDEIDLSRGDMLVHAYQAPEISRRFEAMLVWMHPQPMQLSQNFLLKHTTRITRSQVLRIVHRVNISTHRNEPARQLQMNDIAAVELQTTLPVFFDPYEANRTTGSFILIDPISNATVAAGMIRRSVSENDGQFSPVSPAERFARNAHRPAVILLKNAELGRAVERKLFDDGFQTLLVDEAVVDTVAARTLFELAENAGFVLIVSLESSRTELSHAPQGISVLDLSSSDSGTGAEAMQRVASLARSLRNLGGSNDI